MGKTLAERDLERGGIWPSSKKEILFLGTYGKNFKDCRVYNAWRGLGKVAKDEEKLIIRNHGEDRQDNDNFCRELFREVPLFFEDSPPMCYNHGVQLKR